MSKKLFLQTFGWPLFRDCGTCLPGGGRGGVGIFICLSFLLAGVCVYADENAYMVREGEGIDRVAMIGSNVSGAEEILGKADRIVKEDHNTDLFYEYHKKGLLLVVDKHKKIQRITVYTNTGEKGPFHKTDLSVIYQTFNGSTSKGLRFKDTLLPEYVYAIYGKPDETIRYNDPGVHFDTEQNKLREGKPFIYDAGEYGSFIHYPKVGITFSVFNGLVKNCEISKTNNKR